MRKKFTDFELALAGAATVILADLTWLVFDMVNTFRADHILILVGIGVGFSLTAFAWNRHIKTGKKPVQSLDDIDYRIELMLQKVKFHQHEMKEKVLRHKRHH